MSNFGSTIERTMRLQLQRFAHFQAPIPLLVALVVFSGFSVARNAPSVSALATTLRKTFTKSSKSEGILNTLLDVFTHTLNTACLRIRVYIKLPIRWQTMFGRSQGPSQGDDSYATPRAEAKYWRVAGRYRRRLYSGNNSSSNSSAVSRDTTLVPLVTYYTPRLLPPYRNRYGGKHSSRQTNMEAQESRILPRTFCKWHRMVFPNSRHPTLAQAAVQMRYYSNRDLHEIQRIARLLPDERVFAPKEKGTRRAKRATKYSEMWTRWLENKGMDLVIVFE